MDLNVAEKQAGRRSFIRFLTPLLASHPDLLSPYTRVLRLPGRAPKGGLLSLGFKANTTELSVCCYATQPLVIGLFLVTKIPIH